MSLYRLGVAEGSVAVPAPLVRAHARGLDLYQGFGAVRSGESRFYRRGLSVGAETPGVVGSLVDSLLGLILDVAHVLLLLGGMMLLWRGIAG